MESSRRQFQLNTNKTIVLELNHYCNLQCIHCYIPNEEKYPQKYITFADAHMLLDQIEAYGFKRILITGGEPLANPDFERIYSYAWEKGFIITLFSNATLMNESIKKLLITKKPALLRVSLFGADNDSYEKITGQDLFSLVYKNILYMKKNGVNVTVKIPLLRQNNPDGMKTVQQELGGRGISTKIEVRILPRFDGDTETLSYRYTPEEIMALGIDNQTRGMEKYKKIKQGTQKKAKDINHCLHVCQPFVISPQSSLQLCFFLREWNVSLKTTSFPDALDMLVEQISREQKLDTEFECEDCDKQFMCPYCPGWARSEVGMLNKRIPFLCKLVEGYENKYHDLAEIKS